MKKTRIERAVPFVLITLGLVMGVSAWLALNETSQTFLQLKPHAGSVVLDAGHGGFDGGATSISGMLESGINLEVALKTDALMRFFGIHTVLVRSGDTSLENPTDRTYAEKKRGDLNNRVKLTQGVDNAVLFSIHQNTFPEAKYFGAQVFYGKNGSSVPLAEALQRLFIRLDPENTRKSKKVAEDVFLMNNVTCPAVLVECGFLTNPGEEAKLITAQYQRKIAAVLLAGYLEWEREMGEGLNA